ncbi:MAG: hypothetical protein LBP53_03470 [Candidatus Peribacteria bacterium]|nr:hypothetical protein [Candidatus Peribacteria bacterium]
MFTFLVLASSLRLRSRDVRYLTKKRNYFVKGGFGFFYYPQYSNRPFHQFSCHITIKLSKHATKRNLLKRMVMNTLRQQNAPHLAIHHQFYKIFIVLDKNNLTYLQTLVQNKEKNLTRLVQQAFLSAFTSFQSFLCSKK